MKEIDSKVMWIFAIGQLGWSILSGIIVNWLVYFYQPDSTIGGDLFIPQGLQILGLITIIGLITAFCRVFDAFIDPLIASLSDRLEHKNGRRIPFLKWASIPFAVSTWLVFFSPVRGISWINVIFLFVMLILFYISLTSYCTPYNALIPELAHTQNQRLNLSTCISLTFFVGTAIAYVAPVIWGFFEPILGRTNAIRLTFGFLCIIAFICLIIPVIFINEKDYSNSKPSEANTFESLSKTFRNMTFRIFVASDVFYWIALTLFQTGLPFYITSLLKLPENMTTVFFLIMMVLSLTFYIPVNLIAKKFGKKRLVLFAFSIFTLAYTFTVFCGASLPISTMVQGIILVCTASLPMAIFGILPQAMVADISTCDGIETGENREGMFYAARTFAFKLGQGVSLLLFTAFAAIGQNGYGYRLTAGAAAVFCLLGGFILVFYNEKNLNNILRKDKI